MRLFSMAAKFQLKLKSVLVLLRKEVAPTAKRSGMLSPEIFVCQKKLDFFV